MAQRRMAAAGRGTRAAGTRTQPGRGRTHTLTIECAGLTTLVLDRKHQRAEAWMVEAEGHHQVLVARCPSRYRRTDAPAVTAVAIPGDWKEYAAWSIGGAGMTIESDVSPGLSVTGTRALANVSEAAQATGLAADPPLAFRLAMAGRVSALPLPPRFARNTYYFADEADNRLTRPRSVAYRFACRVPFAKAVTLRWRPLEGGGAAHEMTFTASDHVVLSNLCEAPSPGRVNDFSHHGRLVDGRRPIRFTSASTDAADPEWAPEYCIVALILGEIARWFGMK